MYSVLVKGICRGVEELYRALVSRGAVESSRGAIEGSRGALEEQYRARKRSGRGALEELCALEELHMALEELQRDIWRSSRGL